MIDKSQALQHLRPKSQYIVRNNELEWLDKEQIEPTEEEIQAKIIELEALEPMRIFREQRNQLLSETDVPWGLADYTHPNKQAWLDYRQALRDITTDTDPQLDENGNLINVNWPTPPTETV